MELSGVQLKEAVDLIESRIPGGKWLTRITLFLILAVVIIASVSYIWSKAVIPLARVATALITGATFNLQITVGDVLIWIVLVIVTVAFGRLISRMLTLIEAKTDTDKRTLKIIDLMADEFLNLQKVFNALTERVTALEKVKG